MAEYTRVEELSEYPQALADHKVALATAAGDETEKLRAELAWSHKLQGLRENMQTHNDAVRSLTAARANVKTEFPEVPEHLYAGIQDPEQMKQMAKDFTEALNDAKVQQAQGVAVADTPSAGQPPTGIGSPQGNVQTQWEQRYNELVDKNNVNGGLKRGEMQELVNMQLGKLGRAHAETQRKFGRVPA